MVAIVMTIAIVSDQVVKQVVAEWLGPTAIDHRRELAGRLLALEYVENTGAAFGMFAGRVWVVSFLAVAVAALFIVLIVSHLAPTALNQVAIGMIFGGAVGNMIDRVRLGYVIDYVAVGSWPKFNIADSAITIGVAIVLLGLVRDQQPGSSTSAPSPERPSGSSSGDSGHYRERNGIAH